MKKIMSTVFRLAATWSFFAVAILAANKASAQMENQPPPYGSQLMTQQERNEYREKMRAAKSSGERERIRKQHHEQMKDRAKMRGITLPDEPPERGGGMGPPGGMGPRGGGMGPREGRGR